MSAVSRNSDAAPVAEDVLFDNLVGTQQKDDVAQTITSAQALEDIAYLLLDPARSEASICARFNGVLSRSYQARGACGAASLLQRLLPAIRNAENTIVAEHLIETLELLASYNVSLADMKGILALLRNDVGLWGIIVPPIKALPAQGYTFSTWVRFEAASLHTQAEAPTLFSLLTRQGHGITLRFDMARRAVASCLQGKGMTASESVTLDKHALPLYQWVMVTVVHTRGRFMRKSELNLYVDGYSRQTVHLKYPSISEVLSECMIGAGLSGQMGPIYMFSEPLQANVVHALYELGPNYLGAFDDTDAVDAPIGDIERKSLFDGKLAAALMFTYNAKACEKQLCLEASHKPTETWFSHVPHATLKKSTPGVCTQSFMTALRAVGGVQTLVPLFAQLDQPLVPCTGQEVDYAVDQQLHYSLFSLLSDVILSSRLQQHQMVLCHGFVVIGYLLEQAFPLHMTEDVLKAMLHLGRQLLKQYSACLANEDSRRLAAELYGHLLLRGTLWIYAAASTQVQLYSEIAADMVPIPNSQWPGLPRDAVNVARIVDLLNDFYWLTPTETSVGQGTVLHPVTKGIIGERPLASDISAIRSYLLLIIKHAVTIDQGMMVGSQDMRSIILLLLVSGGQEGQVLDVLQLLLTLMRSSVGKHHALMTHFDELDGVRVLLHTISATDSELVQIYSVKIIGCYLDWRLATKQGPNEKIDVFFLLSAKLPLTAKLYHVLYEVMTSQVGTQVVMDDLSSSRDAAATVLVHPRILETLFLLLQKEREDLVAQAAMALHGPSEELRGGTNQRGDALKQRQAHNIKLTRQLLADLLTAIKGNRQNLLALQQLENWHDWFTSVLSWAVVACATSREEGVLDGGDHLDLLRHDSRGNPTEEAVEAEGADITATSQYSGGYVTQAAPPSSRVTRRAHRSGREEYLHIVDLVFGVLREAVHYSMRHEKDGWSFLEAILASLHADRPSHAYRLDFGKRDDGPKLHLDEKPKEAEEQDLGTAASHEAFQVAAADVADEDAQQAAAIAAIEEERRQLWRARWRYAEHVLIVDILLSFEGELAAWRNDKSMSLPDHIASRAHSLYVNNMLAVVVNYAAELLPLHETADILSATHVNSPQPKRKSQAISAAADATLASSVLGDERFEEPLEIPQPTPDTLHSAVAEDYDIGAFQNLAVAHKVLDALDALVFGSNVQLHATETRFQMPQGSVLRLCMRLICYTTNHTRDWGIGARLLSVPNVRTASRRMLVVSQYNSGEEAWVRSLHRASHEQEVAHQSRDLVYASEQYMRPVLAEKDRLRMRATLYRDSDEYQGQSLRILLLILRQLTHLIRQGYQAILEHGQTATRSDARGRNSSISSYMLSAFTRALDLFREAIRDHTLYLKKRLVVNKRPILEMAAQYMGEETNVIALVMFISSSDWLEAMRLHADPEWQAVGEEISKVWERFAERLVKLSQSARQRQTDRESESVRMFMGYEAATELFRMREIKRKEPENRRRLVRAFAKRLWLALTDKVRHSLEGQADIGEHQFWKLDMYEDHQRRRFRFVRNYAGTCHPEASVEAKRGSRPSSMLLETPDDQPVSQEDGSLAEVAQPLLSAGIVLAMKRKGVAWGSMTDKRSDDAVDNAVASLNESQDQFALDELYDMDGIDDVQNVVPSADPTSEAADKSAVGKSIRALQQLAGRRSFWKTSCCIVTAGLTANGTMKFREDSFSFVVDMEELQKADPEADTKYRAYIDSLGGTWLYDQVAAVYPRRHLLRPTAVEIFLTTRQALMFTFDSAAVVAKVIGSLPASWLGLSKRGFLRLRSDLRSPPDLFAKADITRQWQRRELTNFEYLMRINTLSGRTYNDLNQYPVFPWVLCNYESAELDLADPRNYRDLGKPIGAMNERRLAQFVERFELWDDPDTPPFHYGSHYSTAGYVLYWLIRMEPFTTLFLNLQGGRFDHSTRLFSSVQRAWNNCLDSTTDVKELIPEMFYLPEMLMNKNGYDLGVLEDNTRVGDVVLPPWAKGDPHNFIRIHREALESDYVSAHLHKWIDLVFGYKQQGEAAVHANNVFYHLTYEGAVDFTAIEDPVMRKSIEQQIVSFGQTPSQLLTVAHPPRYADLGESKSVDSLTIVYNPVTAPHSVTHVGASSVLFLGVVPHSGAGFVNSLVSVSASQCYAVHRLGATQESQETPNEDARSTWSQMKILNHSSVSQSGKNKHGTSAAAIGITVDPVVSSMEYAVQRRVGPTKELHSEFSAACFAINADRAFYDSRTMAVLWCCNFWDNSFRCYALEANSARLVQTVQTHTDTVTCLAISHGHSLLVTGSNDTTVMIWAAVPKSPKVQKQAKAIICEHQSAVRCVAVSADLDTVVSGSFGQLLVHTTSGELVRTIHHGTSKDVRIVKITPTGHIIAYYADSDGTIAVYTINGHMLKSVCVGEQLYDICVAKRGQFVATAGSNGCVVVRAVHSLSILTVYDAHGPALRSIAFSADENWLLAGMDGGAIAMHQASMAHWRLADLERLND